MGTENAKKFYCFVGPFALLVHLRYSADDHAAVKNPFAKSSEQLVKAATGMLQVVAVTWVSGAQKKDTFPLSVGILLNIMTSFRHIRLEGDSPPRILHLVGLF